MILAQEDLELLKQLKGAGERGRTIRACDTAGQTILQLLHKAAGVAEANSKHALDMAQKLSHQLRTAEDRIAELEAEVGIYQDKADRAGTGHMQSKAFL
jgi:hypothetical protein